MVHLKVSKPYHVANCKLRPPRPALAVASALPYSSLCRLSSLLSSRRLKTAALVLSHLTRLIPLLPFAPSLTVCSASHLGSQDHFYSLC